jgi:hypothetical protein
MPEGAKLFSSWGDFYLITGGAAGALIGLQFVVIVLSAEFRMGSADTTRAFATPTIVHFCAVLLLSAIMTAPWHSATVASAAIGAAGGAGLAYTLNAVRAARRQSHYEPVLEDWLTHFVLPAIGYAALVTAAFLLGRAGAAAAPLIVAVTTIVLLFTSIHNAWDSVTYVADEGRKRDSNGGA